MPKYVYSTLASDNVYATWVKGGGDLQRIEHSVTIKGGAGVADKRIETPLGVVTEVSDEDLKVLMTNEVFKRHLEHGFVKVDDKRADPETVAADMERNDPGAPLTDADFKDTGTGAPRAASNTGKKHK